MRFLHIDPVAHTVKPVEADNPSSAIPARTPRNTDHGVVRVDDTDVGMGIVVYEFGLLEGDGPYFALGGQLYARDAVLYAFDLCSRDTVDMPKRWDGIWPLWLDTKADVEEAIKNSLVRRPQTSINGVVYWSWK